MKKTVLLVDDSKMSRMMMKKCLPPSDEYSYELNEVDGGRKCLDLYRETPFDLVLLDLTMPGMDGYETLEELKKMDPGAKVIVVTADIQKKALERVLALGALEVVKKPPSKEKMTAVLEKYLQTMEVLTEMRREALQEIINISFGRASASLSELLNVYVKLSVPNVQEIDQCQICDQLEKRIGADKDVTLVQQLFRGDFKGEVLLAIPADAGAKAITMLHQGSGFASNLPENELETEVSLEIGNIVIGACMGQFADLLKTSVSYEVPNIILDKSSIDNLRCSEHNAKGRALLVRTEFQLGEKALTGFLFILFAPRWFNALYLALDRFIESMT